MKLGVFTLLFKEDGLMSIEEGFRKGVANLKSVILEESTTNVW